jgi:hypothetical protein
LREHKEKYVRQDVYSAEKKAQENSCLAKHVPLDQRLLNLEKRMDSFDRKVTATLVFGVVTLVTIVLAIVGKVF